MQGVYKAFIATKYKGTFIRVNTKCVYMSTACKHKQQKQPRADMGKYHSLIIA